MKNIYNNFVLWLVSHVDKVLHFAVCAILTVYGALLDFGFAIFLPIFVGVCKEIIDAIVAHRKWRKSNVELTEKVPDFFCWGDLIADFLGVLVVALPLYFIIY